VSEPTHHEAAGFTDPGPSSEASIKAVKDNLSRAIIYLRVSTKEQAEMGGEAEGYSIPAQREACLKKAESLGAVVVEEFVDRGESAKSADRPELKRLLKFMAESQVDFVIVHKVDRLARNRVDDVGINVAIRKAGAVLVSVTENIDDTPSGMLLHAIMSSLAEFYSRNLATEVIKGSLQKVKSGGTVFRAPVGYLNVTRTVNSREVKTVEIDPERAPLIKWAFEAYADGGWTLLTLQAELERRGLTRPAGPNTPSAPISHSTLHRILRNSYYVGLMYYRGLTYPGNHEPLISEETFSTVQSILEAQNYAGEKQRRHHHYLKGSVFCGDCESRLIVSRTKNRHGTVYPYFVCIGRHQRRTTCTRKAMLIEDIEKKIEAYYGSIRLTPERTEELRAFVQGEFDRRRLMLEAEERIQRRRVDQLKGERARLLQAYYADAIPLDLLKKEQQRVATQLKAAENRLRATEANFATIEANLDQALSIAGECQAMYRGAGPRIRRLMNQAFFTQIFIDLDGSARGDLAAPFALLLGDDLLRRRAKPQRRSRKAAPATRHARVRPLVFQGSGSTESLLVPPAGFEPAISALKGRHPGPLDDGGREGF
jgi:site-specific DNA recombinase